jgi:hypothetical protein
MTTTPTTPVHEVTPRFDADGTKIGYTYRGVIILGSDKRSTQYRMVVGKGSWVERSTRTNIERTTAWIDRYLDGGHHTVNAKGEIA